MEFSIVTRKTSRRIAKKVKPEDYFFLCSMPQLKKVYSLMPIIFVPDPIIQHILSYLDGWNLNDCLLVNRRFYQLISGNQKLSSRILKTKQDYIEEEKRIWKAYDEYYDDYGYRFHDADDYD